MLISANLPGVEIHILAGELYTLTFILKTQSESTRKPLFFFKKKSSISPFSGNPINKEIYVLSVLSFLGT
jgi:hypothetical protein